MTLYFCRYLDRALGAARWSMRITYGLKGFTRGVRRRKGGTVASFSDLLSFRALWCKESLY